MTLEQELVEEGREQGRKEGWQAGRQEGRQEGKIAIARKLLDRGHPAAEVAELTGLDLERMKALAQ